MQSKTIIKKATYYYELLIQFVEIFCFLEKFEMMNINMLYKTQSVMKTSENTFIPQISRKCRNKMLFISPDEAQGAKYRVIHFI